MPARAVTAGRVALACLAGLVILSATLRAAAQTYTRPSAALTAAVEVRLPPGAELWFDGLATPAAERNTFTTPPLQPELTYIYDVQARWREGRDLVVRSERVTVRAGEAVLVDFTRPRTGQGRPDHMAIREIAPAAPVGRMVPAADESLIGAPGRRLTGYMAVVEFDPRSGAAAAEGATPLPPYMSIVEFHAPRR
jgi:uncharacterized protein (TIGR03000 family)